ncbi:hypothetical protein EDB84DRAFT_1444690 [Lactarius hengduanensis]|nr:hypothetical protein EDB84DRAFT_1444690 [Lactarius hengduanensis]
MAPPPSLFLTVRDGDVGTNNTSLSSTLGAQPARPYPNREVSNGVWQFQTEVVDGYMKHTFTTQTDMKWLDFLGEDCLTGGKVSMEVKDMHESACVKSKRKGKGKGKGKGKEKHC